jgi:mRNA-degrading endonuclease toxin of MazEF toxin-antitoxin module
LWCPRKGKNAISVASRSSAIRASTGTTSRSGRSRIARPANLSQLRLYNKKRLIRKIGTLDERTFRELAKALTLTLFPFLSS